MVADRTQHTAHFSVCLYSPSLFSFWLHLPLAIIKVSLLLLLPPASFFAASAHKAASIHTIIESTFSLSFFPSSHRHCKLIHTLLSSSSSFSFSLPPTPSCRRAHLFDFDYRFCVFLACLFLSSFLFPFICLLVLKVVVMVVKEEVNVCLLVCMWATTTTTATE